MPPPSNYEDSDSLVSRSLPAFPARRMRVNAFPIQTAPHPISDHEPRDMRRFPVKGKGCRPSSSARKDLLGETGIISLRFGVIPEQVDL